jgi:four helix bundle protein
MRGHYKDLLVWRKSVDLVHAVYVTTEQFPKRETYGLASQMQRAAVSVPSNIAEGQAYLNRREFLRFLRHARGSLAELETQLIIAIRLNYVSPPQSDRLLRDIGEIGRMLSGLVTSLKEFDAPELTNIADD